MKNFLIATLIFMIAANASAQFKEEAKIANVNNNSSMGIQPTKTPFSLIDLSRVKWSNSYSVVFFSGGEYTGSMGLLNTSMLYDISSKLSLYVNLGIAHNAGALWGDGNNNATILPGFLIDYHPSKNFRMSIGVQRYNGYMNPYSINNPYSYDLFNY